MLKGSISTYLDTRNEEESSYVTLSNGPYAYVAKPTSPEPDKYRHILVDVYFVTPILCLQCEDYIWGTGKVGFKCKECHACFHHVCADFSGQHLCQWTSKGHALPGQVFDKEKPVSEWTSLNVVEWMSALNLYRYADVFKSKDIKGSDLFHLDREKLMNMGIKDEFHQKNILVCIEELCQTSSSPILSGNDTTTLKSLNTIGGCELTNSTTIGCGSSASGTSTSIIGGNFAPGITANPPPILNSHNLVPHSFSVLERCDKCHKYLRGLLHQGFLCQDLPILKLTVGYGKSHFRLWRLL